MTTRPRLARLVPILLLAAIASSCTHVHVLFLASDDAAGRQNGTGGSAFAQNYIIGYLRNFVPAMDGTTDVDAYRSAMTGGTNIIAMLPGSDPTVSDEIVVVGAHYDHIGSGCPSDDPADSICNGATDNAAGAGIVLEIARALADVAPRRTVVFAFWDREEDGLIGSREWVQDPSTPIDDVVAYVNFDIAGANLLPSLRDFSVAVASETGGPAFETMVADAIATQPLETRLLSSTFGQGRSDYVNFLNVGIPSVFFTDSTGPCYHTAQDEYSVVDRDKLQEQTEIGVALTVALADVATAPTFVAGSPLATFDDAVALSETIDLSIDDLDRFTPAQQSQILANQTSLAAIVAAGSAAFGAGDVTTTLLAALDLVNLLSTGSCDGFLD